MKLTMNSFVAVIKLHSFVYLWIATLIFAASSSVTRQLTELGARHLMDGRNPISLCNVLFVGNLCALFVMLPLFRKELTIQRFRQLDRKDWVGLSAIALLSGALAPALIFTALDHTTVTSVIIISRLEPILGLLFSVVLFRERVNRWAFMGTVFSFAGVVIAALLSPSQLSPVMGERFHIHLGELLVACAAVILAIAGIISKKQLHRVPLGLFSTFRTTIGTVIFFSVAVVLYGKHHFIDAFSPFLWKWMVLYGSIIVVVGQLCWFRGIQGATSAEVTLANSLNPLAAILMASIILHEVPTSAQFVGGSIMLLGVALSAIGKHRAHGTESHLHDKDLIEMDMEVGFKGI